MLNLNKTHLIPGLIIGLITILLSCHRTTPVSEDIPETVTPVTITSLSFKPVISTVDLPAVTSYLNKSIIRATTTGTIEKILVQQGDMIKADQLLFTIRTREAMALNNSISSDSSLIFKGLINIISHKSGIISTVAFQKGDFVLEGDELASVSDQNSLVFILEVPFELDRYVEKNRDCSILLPDNRKIKGIITGKLAEMDMLSQTVKYVVKPLESSLLPANLIASIKLIKSSKDNAAVLPKEAVLGNETQTDFWVMKLINDTTAIKISVIKGFENNEEVEITDPKFLISDRFVLTGNYGLPDTAIIVVKKE